MTPPPLASFGSLANLGSLSSLQGRRALVTGAAKGIGAAIAARLAEAGAAVTLADLDEAAGAATAAAISEAGGVARFVACDVTDAAQLRAAVDTAADGGALHVLVNNAGIFPTTGAIGAVADAFVARMLEVNVRAAYSAAREAAARMGEGGSIVNLASIAGLKGGAGISAYATSKAAIGGLTRSFANELGPVGIRVNAIAPGIIDTPGVRAQLAPLKASGVDIDARIAANPLRLTGQPDHVATVAVFLASDLSAFVTGQVIVVDGGATA